jgi:endonuclease YncB( thermonuclease family)
MGTEAAAEIKKLEMMRKADASGAHEKPLFRMLTKSGGVAGFEDIEGVKIIATGTTQGDRLTIEHDGKQMAIRLLWVECAPLTEAGDSGKGFAKHFGISTDNTSALARAAREFTMGYLEGKPLRLLIRPGKDKDGSQAALVFLPEVGLFQNVLVDQGLAAVHQPIKDVPRGMIEKSLLSNLLEREAAAKRRKNGAWALGSEDQ